MHQSHPNCWGQVAVSWSFAWWVSQFSQVSDGFCRMGDSCHQLRSISSPPIVSSSQRWAICGFRPPKPGMALVCLYPTFQPGVDAHGLEAVSITVEQEAGLDTWRTWLGRFLFLERWKNNASSSPQLYVFFFFGGGGVKYGLKRYSTKNHDSPKNFCFEVMGSKESLHKNCPNNLETSRFFLKFQSISYYPMREAFKVNCHQGGRFHGMRRLAHHSRVHGPYTLLILAFPAWGHPLIPCVHTFVPQPKTAWWLPSPKVSFGPGLKNKATGAVSSNF